MHDIVDYDKFGNDPVEIFAKEFLKDGLKIPLLVPSQNPFSMYEGATSIRLYKKPPFQVEFIAVPPNTVIPEHGHPNIDSIEIYLGGQFQFSVDGKFLDTQEFIRQEDESGLPVARGQWVRVKPNQPHGGIMNEQGGVFISIQYWLNNEPTHVGYDWNGIRISKDHQRKVLTGNVEEFDGVLTPRHGATKETN